jgi:K+-transporting ATPase ATPase C chain
MNLLKNFIKSFFLVVALALIFGIIYPMFIFLFSKLAFNNKSNGSLVKINNKIIGSKLLGQKFTSNTYFNSRPSESDYFGLNESSSNLSQTSKIFYDRTKKNAAAYRKKNFLSAEVYLPNDSVTSSASGLDPHISYLNALLQAERVAKYRNTKKEDIKKLIDSFLKKNYIYSSPCINVLMLNLELDKQYPIKNY